MTRGKWFVYCVLLVACFGLWACGGGESLDGSASKVYDEDPRDAMVMTVTILDTNGDERSIFSSGEPVVIRIDKTNTSEENRNLIFPTSQRYDISVYDLGEVLVWNWAHDKAFTQATTILSFTAFETKTFEETWLQTNNAGNVVEIGHYVVYVNDQGPFDILIE